MSGHDSTAKSVRLMKEKNPDVYCPKCLWRTGGGYCPRHAPVIKRVVAEEVCAECFATCGMHEENCPTLKVPA